MLYTYDKNWDIPPKKGNYSTCLDRKPVLRILC